MDGLSEVGAHADELGQTLAVSARVAVRSPAWSAGSEKAGLQGIGRHAGMVWGWRREVRRPDGESPGSAMAHHSAASGYRQAQLPSVSTNAITSVSTQTHERGARIR